MTIGCAERKSHGDMDCEEYVQSMWGELASCKAELKRIYATKDAEIIFAQEEARAYGKDTYVAELEAKAEIQESVNFYTEFINDYKTMLAEELAHQPHKEK
jgi:hypothetical protein